MMYTGAADYSECRWAGWQVDWRGGGRGAVVITTHAASAIYMALLSPPVTACTYVFNTYHALASMPYHRRSSQQHACMCASALI